MIKHKTNNNSKADVSATKITGKDDAGTKIVGEEGYDAMKIIKEEVVDTTKIVKDSLENRAMLLNIKRQLAFKQHLLTISPWTTSMIPIRIQCQIRVRWMPKPNILVKY
uniref:Variable outer membrane protein n=1 Tax=Romanomermis culicivorax TaxID=13658 RepID=A0A915L3B3_ROMCU